MGTPAALLQTVPDGPGRMGAPEDGLFLRWNNTTRRFEVAAPPAGVTDHGALTGLADDDHGQYLLINGTRAMTGTLTLPATGSIVAATSLALTTPIVAVGGEIRSSAWRAGTTQTTLTGAGFSAALNVDGIAMLSIAANSGAGTRSVALSGPTTIFTHAAAGIPLIARGTAAQTANSFEAQNSAGTMVAAIGPTGSVALGGSQQPGAFGSQLWCSGQVHADRYMFAAAAGAGMLYSGGTWLSGQANNAGVYLTGKTSTGKILEVLNDGAVNKLGFFAVAPVARAALLADPAADVADLATWAASINTLLKNYGLMATA